MSKKELLERIRKNQAREKAKHAVNWVYAQLRELSDYLEMGTDESLREKCLHAIKLLIAWAKKKDKAWREPWYVVGI